MSRADCEQVLEEIELYLDGELDPSLHQEVHRHLEACGPCMDHADFQRHVRELLKAKCGCDELPDRLAERIRAIVETPPA